MVSDMAARKNKSSHPNRQQLQARARVRLSIGGRMSEYDFILPVPPSANMYWRVWRNRMVVTEEARAYKQEVALLLRGAVPLTGNVSVNLSVYRPRKCGDLDNYNKVLFDALQGLAYKNDSQITEIHSFRQDDKNNPRVRLLVYNSDNIE
jgi:crossover junction endodeoxyribonuclease RusA